MPAPFAIPPMMKPVVSITDSLATVSVVMIACAASTPPSPEREAKAASTPAASLSIGSRSPMSPVEHTPISAAPVSVPSAVRSAATISAVRWVSWNPAEPVHAFAPPEFRTTARSDPASSTCWDHITGAALNRLLVNTPAATCSGPSFTTNATSFEPEALSPAATPAARKPRAALTLMVLSHRSGGPSPHQGRA